MTDLSRNLIATIGSGQDCAAAGYWAVTYLRRAGAPAIVGRIGRTSDRRWHVVLDGTETYVSKHEQAVAWINRRT